MFWLILSVLALLIMAGCLFTVIASKNRDTQEGALLGLIGTGAIWFVVSVFFTVHLVGQRQVGVVENFSGKITGSVGQGTQFTWPWQHILKADIGVRREDFQLDENNAAVSLDQQPIFANLALNYQVEPAQIVSLYKTVGPAWKQILLDSRVLQDFKEVTAQYTAAQITTKRPQLRLDTKQRLSQELSKYDIHVVDFFVSNLGYTSSYREAINAKNVQVQKALQAQAKVAQSTAEAEQAVAIAKGNAQAIELKGKALRNNPEVLQLEAIDKLNPNAQVIICTGTGSGNCPSFLPANLTQTTTGK